MLPLQSCGIYSILYQNELVLKSLVYVWAAAPSSRQEVKLHGSKMENSIIKGRGNKTILTRFISLVTGIKAIKEKKKIWDLIFFLVRKTRAVWTYWATIKKLGTCYLTVKSKQNESMQRYLTAVLTKTRGLSIKSDSEKHWRPNTQFSLKFVYMVSI